jgi:dihydropteroate synthase
MTEEQPELLVTSASLVARHYFGSPYPHLSRIIHRRMEKDLWVRPLGHLGGEGVARELQELGASATEAMVASSHGMGCAVRVEGISVDAARWLREQVRAVGGAAVIGSSAYASGREGVMDVVVLGSQAQLRSLGEGEAAGGVTATVETRLRESIRRALGALAWKARVLEIGEYRLDLSKRVGVMGIVNVTPDSFFDGGRHNAPEAAIEFGLQLVEEGADILDVGGDSAGGKAARIDAIEEIRRVVPVIRGLARQSKVPIAVDTHRARTAAAALQAGASMVNDITGLGDPDIAGVVAQGKAGVCVMHIKGVPKEFPPDFDYRSLLGDVIRFLAERTGRAVEAGVRREAIVVDPGIEFGKLLYQDLELLCRLPELHVLGYPVLVAVSRKDVIGNVLGLPPEERLEGTAAAVAFSVMRGAHLVRVHDVKAMVRVVRMTEALVGHGVGEGRRRSDGMVV